MAGQVANVCAGPFGAFYDFYIERPRLMQAVGRTIWGIDASVLYASMRPIEEAGAGAVIAGTGGGGDRPLPQARRHPGRHHLSL